MSEDDNYQIVEIKPGIYSLEDEDGVCIAVDSRKLVEESGVDQTEEYRITMFNLVKDVYEAEGFTVMHINDDNPLPSMLAGGDS